MVFVGINLVSRASFLTQIDRLSSPINWSALGKKHREWGWQGIIQEFNLGVVSHMSITLWCKLCIWGIWGGGGTVRPRCKPSAPPPLPTILLYITSRFASSKHLFRWQLILIFLYLTSAWMFSCTLGTGFPSSYSAMMHAHSTSFPVLLS